MKGRRFPDGSRRPFICNSPERTRLDQPRSSAHKALTFFFGRDRRCPVRSQPASGQFSPGGRFRQASEVILWGAGSGKVTLRDNSGHLSSGRTATSQPMRSGDRSPFTRQFAREHVPSGDALARDNLLCSDMNVEPFPREHGFPVRLIAPGCYGRRM